MSVTTSGNTEILSLKTPPGSDMDITNNIFIYINDILQTPQSAYTFKVVESSLVRHQKQTLSVLYSTLEVLREMLKL